MASDFIVDVNEENFEYEVLSYSDNLPVVVDFWAPWCKPCKTLGPMLEALAVELGGTFRLAKVNVDDNPNLALRYGVRSIPVVKAFSQGEMVAQFTGLQPMERVRDFLSRLAPPSPANLASEKAASLLSEGDYLQAEDLFREALETNPHDPKALLGLSKTLLAMNQPDEAEEILENFPDSRLSSQARLLLPLAKALTRIDGVDPETDLDAAFLHSLRLAGKGKLMVALDGLLDVLRENKRYKNGRAREMALAVLEMLGEDHPQTREYRAELANILF